MLDFAHLPAKTDIQLFPGGVGSSGLVSPYDEFLWLKPKGASSIWIQIITPSGAGAPGCSAASGTTRYGSSGGGGPGLTFMFLPAAWLPDALYIRLYKAQIARAGAEAVSGLASLSIRYTPEVGPTLPNSLVFVTAAIDGKLGTTAAAGGTAAGGNVQQTFCQIRPMISSSSGIGALIGSTPAVGAGSDIPAMNQGMNYPGAAGGAVNTDDVGKAGGGCAAMTLTSPAVPGGPPGVDGVNAITVYNKYGIPVYAIPSSGGGSSGTGTGGKGGDGSVGAGGSAGGAGVTGGMSGAGGPGHITIVSTPWD